MLKRGTLMPKTLAYLRVSGDKQDIDSQKLKILEYAWQLRLPVDEFIELMEVGQRSWQPTELEALLGNIATRDILIISGLSKIGQSIGEMCEIVCSLAAKNVEVHIVEQRIRLSSTHDVATKVLVALFGIMAEIEKDLSERREQAHLRSKCVVKKTVRGRNGSTRSCALEGREGQIKELLYQKVPKTLIAKICRVSCPALHYFIRTRGLNSSQ